MLTIQLFIKNSMQKNNSLNFFNYEENIDNLDYCD